MYNYSKIMDDCICIVYQCNSGNLIWVKLTLLFLQCGFVLTVCHSLTVRSVVYQMYYCYCGIHVCRKKNSATSMSGIVSRISHYDSAEVL